ncbi:regulatory signaling modulator protein AmpE [Pseudomonas stutzeri]|nr:regulatory signaling modulator protein AmpE [Stutzerimonas stutzeri]
MSFLVLLLVVALERIGHWRQRTQQDGPFHVALTRVEAAPRLAGRPLRQLLLLVGMPLALLALSLWALAPLAYGILLLPVHLLVLLWSLGRGDPWLDLAPFRDSWQRGDAEAAYLDARRDLGVQAEDASGLLSQVQGFLLWQAQQGFFAVVFWYALLGPLAALAYRLLALVVEHAAGEGLRALAVRLRHLLDWLPARLLALSLALAGNFVATRRVLSGRLLDRHAGAAQLVADAGRAAVDTRAGQGGLESLDELWSLLRRAALLWYSALALWVLLR